MLDRKLLKAEIAKNEQTQKSVASAIGMSEATFIRKMKKGVFGTDEAEALIKFLGIENPSKIFFAKEVT